MVAIVLRFIAYVATLVWRFGVGVVNAIIAWIRSHAKQIQTWLERGIGYGTIIQWILQALGLA